MVQTTDPAGAAPAAPGAVPADLIGAAEVRRITGLTKKQLGQAGAAGLLTTWRPPAGVVGPTRYSRSSAEALARTLLTPATATNQPQPTEAPADARA